MVANRKPTGRAVSMPVGLGLGAVFSLVWTLLGCILVGKLIHAEIMPENAIGYGAGGILLTGSFLSSLLAYHKIKRQRAMVCMIAGGIYFLCLLGITALFFGGQYQAVGVSAGLILSGSGAAVLLGLNHGGRKQQHRYKKPAL